MLLIFKSKRHRSLAPVAGQGTPEQHPVPSVEVAGRRYLSSVEAAYALPKDLQDVPRLDFQHFLLRQAMKGNYLSPIAQDVQTILDVGCGTGRWCCEMALAFPYAQVIGIDLEELPFAGMQRPANYLFKQANVLHPLPFGSETFDVVHQRLMLLSIPWSRWLDGLHELVRVARPGAWIELVEVGCTIFPQGPATQRWYEWIRQRCQQSGHDPDLPVHLARLAREAGIKQVQEVPYDLPIGWGGRLGEACLTNLRSFYDALQPGAPGPLQVGRATKEVTWVQLAKEWRQMQARLRYYVVIGQK